MNIETKLNVGDEAFFIEDNKIKSGEVRAVNVNVVENSYGSCDTRTTYSIYYEREYKTFDEDYLFISLGHALDYLKCDYIKINKK